MIKPMKITLSLPCLILLFTLLLGAPLQAAAESVSQQEAVNIAQQVSPGRVLAIKMTKGTYRVKTLSASGEVRIIVIDANSGQVKSGSK